MRVLVVLSAPPAREGGAPQRVTVGLLLGLRALGLEVMALAASSRGGSSWPDADRLGVEVLPVEPPRPGWRTRGGTLARPFGQLSRGAFGARVRELARSADLLHLEEAATGWCDLGTGAPAVLRLYHSHALDRDRVAPWRPGGLDDLLVRLGHRRLAHRHASVAVSSSEVGEAVSRLSRSTVVTISPLALDPDVYPAIEPVAEPVAGIIGTAAWPGTRQALRTLVEDVWPRVRARVPEARLLVAGRGTDRVGLGGPGVEVLGEVPSSHEFLSRLALLLFPLERGSGMKVKTLEALASGLPVLTTRRGAEGIDGVGAVVVEGAEALASEAVRLLRDAESRRLVGAAGRATFLERYAPEPAARPLMARYAEILAGA